MENHYKEKLEKLQSMVENKKKRTGNIDCVVVMDLTGSMTEFIEKMKEELTDGGGDTAEDLVGGLNQALKLSWRPDSHKIVVLVADAPTHGLQYHQNVDDEFPKGHPDSSLSLEAVMDRYAKLGATFLVFRLTRITEKMFEIIKKQYKLRQQRIRFVDLRETSLCESDEIECNKSDKDKSREKCKRKRKGFKEDNIKQEPQQIRRTSLVNMKITEKILVLSEASEGECDENWDKS